MQHVPSSHAPGHDAASPEFDEHAAGYAAYMENRWKQLAGADAEVFIELKAWHLQEDLRRRPLATRGEPVRLLDFGCGDGVLLRLLFARGFTGYLWGSDVSPGMPQEARDKWRSFSEAHPTLRVPEPVWTESMPRAISPSMSRKLWNPATMDFGSSKRATTRFVVALRKFRTIPCDGAFTGLA